jgi:cytochrome c-type biogenesis protein CcmE
MAVAVCGTLLLLYATTTTKAEIILPSELARTSSQDRKRLRVGGQVAESKINYTLEPEIKLEFELHDHNKKELSIPVIYQDLKPDMFAAGRDVLIDGDFVNGKLYAHTLLTQCPSKYEPPSPEQNINKSNTTTK